MADAGDVWSSRDFPVLREAAAAWEESGREAVHEVPIVEATGLSIEVVRHSVATLVATGFLEGRVLRGDDTIMSVMVTAVTERGMREVGLWPSAEVGADRLIEALDELIEQADDEDSRSWLVKVRDGLVGAGRDIVVSVAAAVLTGQLPSS